MAEIANEQICKRSDGRGWRCKRPVVEGRGYCSVHIEQAQFRQKRQPVPEHLKLERTKRTPIIPKPEGESDDGVTEAPVRRRNKRKMTETSDDVSVSVSDVPRKRAKRVNLENREPVVVDLKLGRLEIAPASSSSELQRKVESPAIKVGAPASMGFKRAIRSKNCEPLPVPVVKSFPAIKENINSAGKKKNNKKKKNTKVKMVKTKNIKAKIVKKCHWCGFSSFCVLVKCSTCKKNFFCQECIDTRLYCKKTVKRECPVCQGECPCRACIKAKPKQVKMKEPVIYDVDEGVIICDHETEIAVPDREKMSEFDISLHLHMIQKLLPVMSKINLEKIIELDTEARHTGICHKGIKVQISAYTKRECSLCKACIPDVHRSCEYCSFVLCLACCHEMHEGFLHSKIEKLKETKIIRSKRSRNKPWRCLSDGRISCPPKHIGGCHRGVLRLTSFYRLYLTKELEESAKRLLCSNDLKKLNGLSDPSPCSLCDENGKAGVYISATRDFNGNGKHFVKHWAKGQAVVVRDVFQSQPDLDWDFGIILRTYLEKSAETRTKTDAISTKNNARDWYKVDFHREQIYSGGITYENVWRESMIFKLRFSFDFLRDHFPDQHSAVIESLPIQEYTNPFTGFMNLGADSLFQTENPNLGSYVNISYGGSDNPMDAAHLSNLCIRACDEVNILVYATARPIRERILNEVKLLMNKYNSQDHLTSSKKISNRNKLEAMVARTSSVDEERHSDVNVVSTSSRLEDTINREEELVFDDLDSESESDDEDLSQVGYSCGAHWDIFRREDVPKLLEYLRKYSDKLSLSYGSSGNAVHPLFDEVFYLDDNHKRQLKEEFNVDALSVEQHIGEAVMIPAGCPYQMRKIKSCVNLVYQFMSPESALESIKVSDEIRLLPVNHKAKGNVVQVKKMAISRMQAAIEAMREVYASQPE
ncbi:putative transcription factor interactor and regulator C3H-WRC/GRF family [Helianthus annuus]|nr:putative transcription factor interactor and regulator C3H-WRC/GRF family [Helianthus annuus]